MKPFSEKIVDERTARLLDLAAKAQRNNIREIIAAVGGNAQSFNRFVKEMGYENHPDAVKIHDLLKTKATSGRDFSKFSPVQQNLPALHQGRPSMAVANSAYEVFKAKNGRFYFRLRARSGEIILSSQGYSLRSSAIRAVQSVRNYASDSAHYETKRDKSGKWYFVLVARNTKVIGTGRFYASKPRMQKGIEAVKRTAGRAIFK